MKALFGVHKVGTISRPKMVSIGNPLRSKFALVIDNVSLIESNNFAIDSTSTTCNNRMSLARGKHCLIRLRFALGVTRHLSVTLMVIESASNSPHLMPIYGTKHSSLI
jgi:hypothetical protein